MNKNTAIGLIVLSVVLLLGVVYYVSDNNKRMASKEPSMTTPTAMVTESTPAQMQASPVPSMMATTPSNTMAGDTTPSAKSLTVNLSSQPGSTLNQTGTATFTEVSGGVKVALLLSTPDGLTGPQPAHIHKGSCPTVGAVVYPLNDVVNGKSETTINVTLQQAVAMLPLAVNVHKSKSEMSVYTACGDIKM